MVSTATIPFTFNTIKPAPLIGAVVSAKLGSRSQHGPRSSAAPADNSCLVGGRATQLGWQHLSVQSSLCQCLTRSPRTPKRIDSIVLLKCGSPPRQQALQPSSPLRAAWKTRRSGLGPLLSLSVSFHLAHDFPDLGSPGVSHLGHQLHSQVNCSSKWSAKQCRKKMVIAMIHCHARITGA